jgi:hypothetical protein
LRGLLPLIISECEFPGADGIPGPERTLYFHDGNNTEPCNAQAGMDADGDGLLAGGFGWLNTDGGCDIALTIGQLSGEDPGSSPTTGCSVDAVRKIFEDQKPIPLPYFSDTEGLGAGGHYRIGGFGLFLITGYNFGGLFKAPDAASAPCHGDERCVRGYFVEGAVYDGEPGGPDHGIVVVKLTD